MPARNSTTGRYMKGGGGGAVAEPIVVRLMGDGSSYFAMLTRAATEAQRATQKISGHLNRLGATMDRVGAKFRQAGRYLSLRVTAPLLGISAASVRAFASFDQAMTESTSIMSTTGDQVRQMRDLALELSTKAPQGPAELAQSYFFLASAGKDAEQSMALLPQVMQFATAGAFDMEKATSLLVDAQSALGMSSRSAARDAANMAALADVLTKANILSNASVEQFATSMTSEAGAAFKAYSISLHEGAALLAAYADQGIKAEVAGTAASRMLRLLTKATQDNAKEFERLNIHVFDASGEFRPFSAIVKEMERALSGMSTEQKIATLETLGFEARIQAVILPLLGASESLARYSSELKKAGGITRDVADKQLKSFSNQMKIFWNRVKVVGIEIGGILAPVITKLSGYIDNAIVFWRRLSPEIKRTAVMVGIAVAAVGPLLIVFGSLVGLFGLAATGVAAFISVIGAMFSPIALLIGLAAALGVAIFKFSSLGGNALDWLGKKWESLKDYIRPAVEGMKNALAAGDIKLAFEIVWAQIQLTWAEGLQPIKEAWAGFVFWWKTAWIQATGEVKSSWRNTQKWIAETVLKLEAAIGDIQQQTGKPITWQGAVITGLKGPGDWMRTIKEGGGTAAGMLEGLGGKELLNKKTLKDAMDALNDYYDGIGDASSKSREQMLADAEGATGKGTDAIRDHIRDLENRLKGLGEKAAKEAKDAQKEIGKGIPDAKDLMPAEIKIPEIVPPKPVTIAVKFETLQGVEVGSAEDMRQWAEYADRMSQVVRVPAQRAGVAVAGAEGLLPSQAPQIAWQQEASRTALAQAGAHHTPIAAMAAVSEHRELTLEDIAEGIRQLVEIGKQQLVKLDFSNVFEAAEL